VCEASGGRHDVTACAQSAFPRVRSQHHSRHSTAHHWSVEGDGEGKGGALSAAVNEYSEDAARRAVAESQQRGAGDESAFWTGDALRVPMSAIVPPHTEPWRFSANPTVNKRTE
jgi:hypothetical protein